jgi:hypothetical protein
MPVVGHRTLFPLRTPRSTTPSIEQDDLYLEQKENMSTRKREPETKKEAAASAASASVLLASEHGTRTGC